MAPYYPLSHFTPSPLDRPNCEPELVLEYVWIVLQFRHGMAAPAADTLSLPHRLQLLPTLVSASNLCIDVPSILYTLYTRRRRPKVSLHLTQPTSTASMDGIALVAIRPTVDAVPPNSPPSSMTVASRSRYLFCPENTSDFKTV